MVTGEDAEGYLALQRFLEQTTGIVIGTGDEQLVAGRLARLMRDEGIGSLRELTRRLELHAAPRLRAAVIDAMTTGETSWFRETAHFRLLTDDVLPAMAARRVRIWSAACATGQEPYSLSIAAHECLQGDPARAPSGIEILATDIAQGALDAARRGVYCGALAARGLSEERRQRHFTAQGDCLTVRNEIRQRVLFRQFNLAASIEVLGRFDVVFCRHVLVYFPTARRREILGRVIHSLSPGGFLFLGAGETLDGVCRNLDPYVSRGGVAYRKH
jgi:chemotaxis protein methyltransferase CheR